LSIKTNVFNTVAVDSTDVAAENASQWTNGVYGSSTSALSVLAHGTPNLTVDVQPGSCEINGYYVKSDAVVNVPISGNSSGFNRIDNIVANVDTTGKVTTIIAVAGIPSSSPVAPTPTSNQLLLATVIVGNNVSVINTINITDARVNVDLFGSQMANLTNNPRAGVGITNGTSQSIATGTLYTIPFNTSFFDNTSMFSGGGTQLICKKAGYYLLSANINWDSNSVGQRQIVISVNGVSRFVQKIPTSLGVMTSSISGVMRLSVNDYIEVKAYQESGGALGISAYLDCPMLTATLIGR